MCFVHVEFYPTLLFRAIYDATEMNYKANIRLPAGKHSISFLQAQLKWDDHRQKNVLDFMRLSWKLEVVAPLEGPPSLDGHIGVNTTSPDTKSVGGNFFTSMCLLLTQISLESSTKRKWKHNS